MSKKKSYPTDGLNVENAIKIAETLNELGGKASKGLFANAIGMSENSGPFRVKLSSMKKYCLLLKKDDLISLTKLGVDLMNSYKEEDTKFLQFEVFTKIELFKTVIDRLSESTLNLDLLDKMFVKDYGVNQKTAPKIKKSFIDSCSYLNILNDDMTLNNNLIKMLQSKTSSIEDIEGQDYENEEITPARKLTSITQTFENPKSNQIYGNEKVEFNEEIFDLISIISSYQLQKSKFDDIKDIIEKNKILTTTHLILQALEDKFENDEVTDDHLNLLLKGLKNDLKIKKL